MLCFELKLKPFSIVLEFFAAQRQQIRVRRSETGSWSFSQWCRRSIQLLLLSWEKKLHVWITSNLLVFNLSHRLVNIWNYATVISWWKFWMLPSGISVFPWIDTCKVSLLVFSTLLQRLVRKLHGSLFKLQILSVKKQLECHEVAS